MIEVKKLKKGDYIMHKGGPWVVKSASVIVTGTHCHSKMKLELQNLFSGEYDMFTTPLHERMEELDITRKSAQLVAKAADGKLQIMDNVSFETFDANADQEIADELSEGDQVTYIEFNGAAKVLEKRA